MLFSVFFIVEIIVAGAAITPEDETYNAKVGKDFTIQWTIDNEADLDQVLWSYKSSTVAATTIMSKVGAASAQVYNNYNVEHVGNGEIKLISVTLDNAGIYFCQVSYTLASGYPTVTGTATLSVTIATATSTKPTITSTIHSGTTTTSTTGIPSVTSTNPTTKSTMLTTTSTTSTTRSTKSTTANSAITVTDNGNYGKLAVIIVSSVVGGLLVVG